VLRYLKHFGLDAVVSPLVLALIAVDITGLLLLDRRQNSSRIADWLPARAHGALNRLLRVYALSTRALMGGLVQWAKSLGKGCLAIDDVVVSKPFSQQNRWVGWTYSTSEKRYVRGFHVVVLLWCVDGWRIPVAFRLWRPKKQSRPSRYRTKPQLAWEMIVEVYQAGLPIEYIVFDTLYTAGWLTKKINRLGLKWVGVLHPNTTVYYRHRRYQVASLEPGLKLKWRRRLQLRARSIVAYLPKYGTV